jgi:hypothetical protein
MPRLRDRPTADLVVLGLALVVGFSVVATTVGALLLRIVDPSADLTKIGARLADVTNTLIGAIVGYLAGRGTDEKPPPPPAHREDDDTP